MMLPAILLVEVEREQQISKEMTSDLDIWWVGWPWPCQVEFEGQGRRSDCTVTGWKIFVVSDMDAR